MAKVSKYRIHIYVMVLLPFLVGCNGENHQNLIRLNQYMVEGMMLYRKHCVNCHQVDGKGLAKLIPPLSSSDYLKKLSNASLACQIRFGLKDSIVVNGTAYKQAMPGIPKLTPIEIAEIVTYVNNTWGAETGLYSVKQVVVDLGNCNTEN